MPSAYNSATPTGTIQPYGGTTAPAGSLLCDGASYLRTQYPQLFSAIGTAFGAVDGTHFNVPDIRGRLLRGVDGTAGLDPDKAARTAMNTGGNIGNNVGSVQSHQVATHNHDIQYGNPGIFGTGTTPLPGGQNYSFNTNAGTTAQLSGPRGGNETRPVNAYTQFIIKY